MNIPYKLSKNMEIKYICKKAGISPTKKIIIKKLETALQIYFQSFLCNYFAIKKQSVNLWSVPSSFNHKASK